MRNAQGPQLAEVVEAAFELGRALSPDRATAAALAARHVERVLVRGSNAHLLLTLRSLATELAADAAPSPARRGAHRSARRGRGVRAA